MTSLLDIRPSAEGPAYLADALPYSYEEAGRAQFAGMPGIKWVRDASSPNGRGFYRGPREAIELVAATLESAKVCRVKSSMKLPQSLESKTALVLSIGPELDSRLRAYQADGAAWIRWQLRHSGAALLADEMGLGKTPQAICAVEHIEGQRLVVCPAVVVPHWEEKEIARWAPTTATAWTVLSYERFAKLQSGKGDVADDFRAQQWGAAIFDEIHYASNPKTQRTKALVAFAAAFPQVPRIGLSGTPMTTRPRDLWQPLDILWPGRFGKAWDFQRRYCDGRFVDITTADGSRVTDKEGEPLRPVWSADGISHAAELRTRLQHCMLRRTKAQVGAELPPRTRILHEVTLPAAARKDLRHASAALAATSGRELRGGVSTLLANSEAYKIDAAEALARDVMASGGRPLLLTTRKDSARQLAERLQCPAVTGDDNAADRADMLADAPAGCATLYSVETGINLTGFDCIVFVGLDWVPSRILQGEARIHRIGQDRPCTIYYLIARGTIDEVIKDRVIARLDAFADITGADGDERGLAHDLAPETEEDLLSAIVAAVKGKAA